MKKLLVWLANKFLTADAVKSGIHKLNAKLASMEAPERAATVLVHVEAASNLIALYAKAFAEDGKMDENELAAVNAACDSLVDLYLPEGRVASLVETAIG